jgi:predicted Zn-dependent protease
LNRTKTLFGAIGALVLAGAVFFRPSARADEARTPSSGSEVLERLPRGDAMAQRRTELRRALAARPQDMGTAVWLARMDIEASRERSDPRYLGQAQAALAPWWDLPSPPEPVLVLRATVRQSLHDFDGALADLDRATAAAPGDVQAWLTRSVVLSVRGRYAEARASCAPVEHAATALVFTICEASIDALTGKAREALDRIEASTTATATPDVRQWATSIEAEIAGRLGLDGESARLFQAALAQDPSDAYSLAAYADLALDEGKPEEAVRLLSGKLENDNLLLRLVLAEDALGAADARAHADLLASRYDASRLRGDTVHRREEARFVLGIRRDPRAALALAAANWGVQREPWDLRVLLAAAEAAKDPATAAPALAFLDEHHLEDPRIHALADRVRAMR